MVVIIAVLEWLFYLFDLEFQPVLFYYGKIHMKFIIRDIYSVVPVSSLSSSRHCHHPRRKL